MAELEGELGTSLRALRLQRNIDQRALASQAGVSTSAVKNLEHGLGSTLKTLISVLRVLGRADWLATVAPVATIDPMTMTQTRHARQRASRRPVSARNKRP